MVIHMHIRLTAIMGIRSFMAGTTVHGTGMGATGMVGTGIAGGTVAGNSQLQQKTAPKNGAVFLCQMRPTRVIVPACEIEPSLPRK